MRVVTGPQVGVAAPSANRALGASWWDTRFTQLLLSCIPPQAQRIADYQCGLATAAHAILPSLPEAHYLGMDEDAATLHQAEQHAASTPLHERMTFRLSEPLKLPLADDAADVMLSILKLQHCRSSRELIGEFRRTLQSGGALVAVEPDNLGQRFYFDGVLEEITQKVHKLCLRARVLRQPADIAIGPRLAKLLGRCGFKETRVVLHTIGAARLEPAKSYCDRMIRVCDQIAQLAGLPADATELRACHEAIKRFLFTGMPKRLGHSAHLVPVFFCTATA
jgi:ubiquinone/menaquinone biosynthesis C-methylase UbiE